MADFSLHPPMVESRQSEREDARSLGSPLIGPHIPFIGTPPSWPTHLLQASPPSTIIAGGKISICKFWGDTNIQLLTTVFLRSVPQEPRLMSSGGALLNFVRSLLSKPHERCLPPVLLVCRWKVYAALWTKASGLMTPRICGSGTVANPELEHKILVPWGLGIVAWHL